MPTAIERRQHPVGQGFFHTAAITVGDASFNYVYDCGSENRKALMRAVDKYLAFLRRIPGGQIDILFVSHLDKDHVSGVDCLATNAALDTVVLPYLSVAERILLLTAATGTGSVDGNYLHMIGDPVGWFSARGVRTIIFFQEGGENQHSDLPGGGPFPTDEPAKAGAIRVDKDVLAPFRQPSQPGQADVFVAPGDIALPVTVYGQEMNWAFLPFVHPERERQEFFLEEFKKLVHEAFPIEDGKVPQNMYGFLVSMMKRPEIVEKLAEAYLDIRADRNLTSLALYSGPLQQVKQRYRFVNSRGYPNGTWGSHFDYSDGEIGWLGTGDANLLRQRRRQLYLQRYGAVMNRVVTIALPHHGSRHNFHSDILPPHARFYTVGVGNNNSYKHPHNEVVDSIKATQQELIKATETPTTWFEERIEFL